MSATPIKILYFAWMREHTGTAMESVTLPATVRDVGALVPLLAAQSAGHALALKNMAAVRVAVNRQYGDLDSAIAPGDEIAFFPPVTGG